ncbi:hypothetical protein [Bryocella elongata]|uniref:hypothetical protein n=1 Tax=Bryocella elongata TaxID=863522 RepID=UPI0011B0C79D|nr:hypothetical protein [Bryocella elongata]
MRASSPFTAIFRIPSPAEAELAGLRAELSLLRSTLAAREQALDDLRCHLISFEGRYIRQVGKLYKQLDEWEQRVAALHPEREEAFTEQEEAYPEAGASEPAKSAPRDPRPALTLRALFRELALRIHPDHALDASDEARRTRLMAQANDAFRRKDLRILRRMLHGFDPGGAFFVRDIEADLAEARDSIAQTRRDIASAEADHANLAASQLADLERSCIQASLAGRDLLAEMAARVKGRIGMAMRQYDLDLSRIKRPDQGMKLESLLSAESNPVRR